MKTSAGICNATVSVASSGGGKQAVEKVRGEFVFEDVGFAYDQGGEAPAALRGINFNLAAGETIEWAGTFGAA